MFPLEKNGRCLVSQTAQECLTKWTDREALAETMIPLVGQLYRNNHVITSIFGFSLINQSVIAILQAHAATRYRFGDEAELTVKETYPLLKVMSELKLGSATIDLGRLAVKYREQQNLTVEDFLRKELAVIIDKQIAKQPNTATGTNVVLYGFGRIGRLLARIMIERTGAGDGLRLRAIVVRKGSVDDLEKRANLLRRDSIHGAFKGTVLVNEKDDTLIVNGNLIKVIYSSDPSSVDYTQYGINNAIVIDNTGKWRDEEGLGQHLKCKGVDRVILTAPGKGKLKNIVYGVNDQLITKEDKILSAASCTTNAIVPVLKVINDKFGIDNGHLETVHSYTNDQNLIDNFHKGSRRGRSAPLNMVITETGAATAAAKALPELAGKLTGNAIRVPTPDVSLAILNLNLAKATSREELNNYLRDISLYSNLHRQIDFIDSTEVVSSDFIGSRHAGIVDAAATICTANHAVVYVWYDNEFGYSSQVIRIVENIANVRRLALPKP